MSPAMQSAALFLLAGVAFMSIGSLLAAVLVRAFGERLMRWEPGARHRALVALAALPVLTAFVLLVAVSLPSLTALAFPELDHCATHDDGHAHLCFVHLAHTGIATPWLLGLVALGSYVAMRALLAASRAVQALRVLAALARTGERRADLDVTLLATEQPICLAVGLFRPRVLVSSGLLGVLDDEARDVVLAHERAHVRRRDVLVATFARAVVSVHVPFVARWLVREIEIAAEQACDEEAASVVGDRLAVASAILSVERMMQGVRHDAFDAAAVGLGRRAVVRRVESLMAEPETRAPRAAISAYLGVATLTVIGCADALHHITESLLSFVAR